jgi:acetyltransferase-like isoleucine patch superfamily enzyme
MCDFDHRFSDIRTSIRAQGIQKTPVHVGNNVWIGTKVSVLRGTSIGAGSVIGAHSVVRGTISPMSVAVGIPAKVVKSRLDVDEQQLEVEHHADSVRLRTLAALNEISGKGLSESTPKRS